MVSAAQTGILQYQDLDLTVLVTNQTGTDALMASAEADPMEWAVPGSLCMQSEDSWGQCTASLSSLDPAQFYWFWFASGLQNPETYPDTAVASLEYGASGSSNCSILRLPSHSFAEAPEARYASSQRQLVTTPEGLARFQYAACH